MIYINTNTFIKLHAISIFDDKFDVKNIITYSIISKYARYFALTGIIKYNKKVESGNVSAKAINIEKAK